MRLDRTITENREGLHNVPNILYFDSSLGGEFSIWFAKFADFI